MSEAEADQFMEDLKKRDDKAHRRGFIASMERKLYRKEQNR